MALVYLVSCSSFVLLSMQTIQPENKQAQTTHTYTRYSNVQATGDLSLISFLLPLTNYPPSPLSKSTSVKILQKE
ncbi:MAG: hypothetical protein J3R72DRAFT_431064 [Linnemannia gamsii]|nr:MAG: hypothetical protein J3R72DRAFT_431064 [Linnemannia gamsii]